MKKSGLLNQPLSSVIAGLGHQDMLCICDAGLPIPDGTQRIDLAVTAGIPSFLDVLDAVLEETAIEAAYIASELATTSPDMHQVIQERLADVEVRVVPHVEFKALTADARAIARTGEFTPYANVILVAGVTF